MNRYVRVLFSATTLGIIAVIGRSLQRAPLVWGCLVALAFVYLVMIWAPESRWGRAKYALAVLLVIGLTVILRLANPGRQAIPIALSLVPLALLLAREQGSLRRFTLGLAILTMAAMLVLAPSAAFVWTVLPVVIALYMSVRAIHIYKQAYRLSQQNLDALNKANLELQQTYAALQEATVHSVRYAALSERARLARDIHDGLGHQLTSLIVQLQALEMMLPGDPLRAAQAVPDMLDVTRKAMAEVRQAVETWREDESGSGWVALQGLVSQFTSYAPLALEFQPGPELSEWPAGLNVALYRILQEALTNILRHAQATAAWVQLQEREHRVILTVSDNGRYTTGMPLKDGYGLKGIRERCQALGGVCRVSQRQPHGLKLEVSLPIIPLEGQPAPGEGSYLHA
jgi:signal transduction histidine kinase